MFPYAVAIALVLLAVVAIWSIFSVILAPDDAVIIQVVPIDDEDLQIQIEGAVQAPGVYSLPAGSTVADGVARAGGFADGANLSPEESSEKLTDGHFVFVPPAPMDQSKASPPIDINSAGAVELEALPGIGPVIASRIIAYREAAGGFSEVAELAEVAGISARMVDDLSRLVVVGPP